MPDGGDDPLAADSGPTTMASASYSGESSLGFSDEVDRSESSYSAPVMEKDPRKIARRYQLELCKKAVEENIIVYLGTGCGKTHIAVLLIYELGHLIRKPQKNICVFLAPTVALVQQQASVIEESVDFKVGICGGSSKRVKNRDDWDKEMKQYEILNLTCLWRIFSALLLVCWMLFGKPEIWLLMVVLCRKLWPCFGSFRCPIQVTWPFVAESLLLLVLPGLHLLLSGSN